MRWLLGISWRTRVAIILFSFPVLALLAAGLFWLESAAYVARAVAVEGTVVQRYEWPGETIFDRGRINYEPIFTYEMDGRQRRASVGSGHVTFDLEIGERAQILVLPGSQGNVRLDTWQGLWFVPAMLAVIGGVALVGALILWALLTATVFRRRPG